MKILLEKLRLYFKRVPNDIKEDEKIVKIIFSPLHFNKKQALRANAYRVTSDDLSVNRLNYTTLNFCKRLGLKLEASSIIKDKKFYGIAVLFCKEIRFFAELFARPVKGNKAHAEIVTGEVTFQNGVPGSAKYIYITEELAKRSRVYFEGNSNMPYWVSENKFEILTLSCPN